MASFRLLVKDIVAYGIMGGVSRGGTLLLLPVLTRAFSPEEYGVIDIVATLSSLLAIAISLVLEAAVARMWFEFESRRTEVVSSILLLILASGMFVVATVWWQGAHLALIILGGRGGSRYLLLGAAVAACTAMLGVPQVVLRMERRIWSYNVAILIQTAMYLALTAVFVFRLHAGLLGLFLAQLISTACGLLVALLMTAKYLAYRISFDVLRVALAYSVPLVPAGGAVWVNAQADRILLLAMLGLGYVGVFGAAAKVALVVALIVTAYQLAWAPLAIAAIDDVGGRQTFYRRGLNYYLACLIAVGLTVVTLSKEIMSMLVPIGYREGYVILPWLVGSHILQGSAAVTNVGMLISKRTIGNSVAAWVGAVANVGIAYALIPRFGLGGAAIGSFIAALIFTAMLMAYSARVASVRFDIPRVGAMLGVYVLASTVLGALTKHILSSSYSIVLRIITLLLSLAVVVVVSDVRGDVLRRRG